MSEIPDRVRAVMQAVSNMHVLATVDAEHQPQMRWMGGLYEDPQTPWTFYLVSSKGSRKMLQLAQNGHAQLLFTKPDDWQVVTITGSAEACDCPDLRQTLWTAIPEMDKYYSGPDDPAMAIIKFKTKCMELLALDEAHEPYCFDLE